MADGKLAPTASIPSVSEMSAPQVGTKCQHHSLDKGVPIPRSEEEETVEFDDTSEECPGQKWKEGRPAAKALKEPHQEAFSKESEVVKVARWAYYKVQWSNFEQDG